MKKIEILYIYKYDKNQLLFNTYFRAIKEYKIHLCTRPSEAVQVLIHFKIDVIIVDQPSPSRMGIEFLDELPSSVKMPLKFLISNHRDSSLLEKAKDEGVIKAFFSEPYKLKEIDEMIKKMLRFFDSAGCS
ncbi:response regulator [Sporocytophaga myxococcoides]|uniref:response regulator n=1 Tax=Sporocytophaga myxococcoides TaxID=153721 RepID=UPI00048E19D6|nr:response regulator [Sporocytophaga myxococcoides]